jgi:hypothetical protein
LQTVRPLFADVNLIRPVAVYDFQSQSVFARKDKTVNLDAHLDNHPHNPANASDPTNLRGFINPNQFFAFEDMLTQDEHCLNTVGDLEDVKADAKRMAECYQIFVTVDVTDAEDELYSDTIVFRPAGWPSKLTVETVASWLWSNMAVPVNAHAILRAFKDQR